MPILSIDRYFVGAPNIVGILTSDTLPTITANNYWKTQIPIVQQLINGEFQWDATDLVLIYYATEQIGFFRYNPNNFTFELSNESGDVNSAIGTANQVLVNGTTGSPQSGNLTLTLPQNIAPTSNPSFNNVIFGYETTVTSAGTKTLTTLSPYLQYFTGSSTHLVILPVTSTLQLGQSYLIINNSSGNVTVNSSGGNLIQTMAGGTNLFLTCILTSGTTDASWNASYNFENSGVNSITGTANQVTASSSTGSVILSLPQSIATTSSPAFSSLTVTNNALISGLTVGRGNGLSITNSVLGNSALAATSGTFNVAIGTQALEAATTGNSIIAIGYRSLFAATAPGNDNICIGDRAMSGSASQSGIRNIAVGTSAMQACTTALLNVGIGYASMTSLTTGTGNTGFGHATLNANSTSSLNTACGYQGLLLCTGGLNTAVGASGLQALTTGANNVGVGYQVGFAGGTGFVALTTGSNNTFLGYQSCGNSASAGGCIAIGALAVADASTGSTSGTNGPGIAIGSSTNRVGFRGDGTIYPTASVGGGTLPLTFSGYLRIKINDTYYKIPLYPD